MNEHLNPNYPNFRGCFIDRYTKKAENKILVVDYPTWHLENGEYVTDGNERIPVGQPYSKEFDTLDAAREFANAENYIICTMPSKLDPNRKDRGPIVADADDEAEALANA